MSQSKRFSDKAISHYSCEALEKFPGVSSRGFAKTKKTPMKDEGFGGAFKKGQSILGPWEKRFVAKWVDRIPACLETYHLTLLTIPWTGLVIASASKFGIRRNIRWFWGVSLAVCLQYITDPF